VIVNLPALDPTKICAVVRIVGSSTSVPIRQGPFADRIDSIRKHVFSSTMQAAPWANSLVVAGDVVKEARKLKSASSGDLTIFGFGQLARALFEADARSR
jgi:hypothetical protein